MSVSCCRTYGTSTSPSWGTWNCRLTTVRAVKLLGRLTAHGWVGMLVGRLVGCVLSIGGPVVGSLVGAKNNFSISLASNCGLGALKAWCGSCVAFPSGVCESISGLARATIPRPAEAATMATQSMVRSIRFVRLAILSFTSFVVETSIDGGPGSDIVFEFILVGAYVKDCWKQSSFQRNRLFLFAFAGMFLKRKCELS